MTISSVEINKLKNYIQHDEVVYQRFGELVEVSNDNEAENRTSLLEDLKKASSVEAYEKGDQFISEDFNDLDSWSTKDDVLILLQLQGTLICIPKKVAVEKEIIAA